jgi:hypothetical protein
MICKQCGCSFKIKPVILRRGGGKFCSNKCWGKYNRGKNNGNWKGGVNNNKKEYQRKWSKKNKFKKRLYCRRAEVKRKFGISLEQYDEILKKQDNKCAICLIDQKDYPRRFSIDHNHITKKVRGLLCTQCNSILGYARDSIETLERAKVYLGLK